MPFRLSETSLKPTVCPFMSSTPTTDALAQEFVTFSVEAGVLRFGDFTTKAGRQSPYFFNTGLFDDGAKLMRLGEFYARRLIASGLEFDMLFGPAYKGITLAAAVAIGLAKEGRSVPYAYNRKEAKDHGEGGTLVGAPVQGRVLIIDDVITDGASKREAADLIRAAGATPVGVAITMDRQERAKDDPAHRRSGVQYVEQELGLRVVSIATLADLMAFLQTTGDPALAANLDRVAAYRARYGIEA
ncbi:MAG: orotate phosphoribosyltransferase [Burkholderiales bacterium]|nr:orotate phosphoribosyltransferase [Burkholderiales bacterium]